MNGVGGVTGLKAVTEVAVKDLHLYAVSYGDGVDRGSLVAFARDAATGDLTFVDRLQDGTGGVDGLDGASALAVYDDNIYVVSQSLVEGDNTLAVFTAQCGSPGAVTFLELHRQGQFGVSGLFGASDVAVSSDGEPCLRRRPHSRLARGLQPRRRRRRPADLPGGEDRRTSAASSACRVPRAWRSLRTTGTSTSPPRWTTTSWSSRATPTAATSPTSGVSPRSRSWTAFPASTARWRSRPATIPPTPTAAGTSYVTGHTADSLVVFDRNVEPASDDFGKLTLVQSFQDGIGMASMA